MLRTVRTLARAMSTNTAERTAELCQNLEEVKSQIVATAQSSNVPEPRLVVVSKYKPASEIQALYDHGHRHFGENYVQELTAKAQELPNDIQWHFIGTLQSNKCSVLAAIPNLYAVETVTDKKKATKLNTARTASDPKLGVFIQVNTSQEDQKSGVKSVDEVVDAVEFVTNECDKLTLHGLMTIGSQESSFSTEKNPDFARLVELKQQVKEKTGVDLELSMGMSSDYLQAIKQGSTNVRVGSAIFGARMSKEEAKSLKS